MRCLTLTQPYASLVAIGAKRIETRSWHTYYRGPLAIHAAKGFPTDAKRLVSDDWEFYSAFEPVHAEKLRLAGVRLIPCQSGRGVMGRLPIGAVVATCQLIDCKFIVNMNADLRFRQNSMLPPPEPELLFGNYELGRYAWILEDVIALPEPIPAKGALGLWEWGAVRAAVPVEVAR